MLFNAKFRLIFYLFLFLVLPVMWYLLDYMVWCNERLFDQFAWCDENSAGWLELYKQSFLAVVVIGIIDFLAYLFWFRKKT